MLKSASQTGAGVKQMAAGISQNAELLRAFAVDFLTCHNPEVARRIMHPGYCLSISGHLLSGREEQYLPATVAQLDLFPGLCVTVHDVILAPDAVAMRFTEHGVSSREGKVSSWGGITLFRIQDGTLRQGWAEEDYYARKLQLRSGKVNTIRAPHPAPWDEVIHLPNSETEEAIRAWLTSPCNLICGVDEISVGGPMLSDLIKVDIFEVSTLFTAGNRGAFHGNILGKYIGGFPEIKDGDQGKDMRIPVAVMADVIDGKVSNVQICADRLGTSRRLSS
ncbi:MAG: nuclear transport factor 2 family protein [Novosphingobium sp.]|nr:nuclear transport factor 2 family protein [Novosphingobium sp.]